jgi:ketosteroid isomerase-like protein
MTEHPNAVLVRKMFDAFTSGDVVGLAVFLAPDATWHIPGSGIVSGEHHGHGAIIAALSTARSAPGHDYRPMLVDVTASDQHAVAIYRARGERDGRTLDLDQLLLMRIDDGIVREVTAYPRSQKAFDEFWA